MKIGNKKIGICEMCLRGEVALTFHHLIPRTLHSRKWFKKNFDIKTLENGINICTDCHRAIHNFINEKELGKTYNTLQALLTHSQIPKFISWVKKQKRVGSKSARSKNR